MYNNQRFIIKVLAPSTVLHTSSETTLEAVFEHPSMCIEELKLYFKNYICGYENTVPEHTESEIDDALAALETELDREVDDIPDNHAAVLKISGIPFIVIVQTTWLYESQHLCPPNVEPLYNLFTNEVFEKYPDHDFMTKIVYTAKMYSECYNPIPENHHLMAVITVPRSVLGSTPELLTFVIDVTESKVLKYFDYMVEGYVKATDANTDQANLPRPSKIDSKYEDDTDEVVFEGLCKALNENYFGVYFQVVKLQYGIAE